ncbi:MAG: efflux RND transporter periplasmic adaptor subunit [Pseudomonadota bacterium]
MRKILRYVGIAIRELFWVAVAVGIVAGGYAGFTYLGENREIVEVEPVERPETLVETMAFAQHRAPLPIRGEGFVEPFRTVALSAPTGGRIVFLHPAITNRGSFNEGEILVEIDGSAERAQIAESLAAIAATEARIDLVTTQLDRAQSLRARNATAQSTVDDLQGERNEIIANLQGQRAQLSSAEIALENKIVRAPFDGAVQSKEAEIGNVVAGGTAIAQIFTDSQMEVSIAIRETDAVLIPGLFTGNPAPATVSIDFAGETKTWAGEIVRIDPALDPQTRTLTTTIALREREDNSTEFASGAPPALINAFAKAVVQGIEPADTFAIPSTALRSDNMVWLIRGGRLAFHPAKRMHVDGETTYVHMTGLDPDDRLVLTTLAAPQEGEALRDVSTETVQTTQVVD